ncbi:MAG TPA: DoxX family protein [Opitutaceae bacterium]|jgi:hypothetical protein
MKWLAVILFIFDGATKAAKVPQVIKASAPMGFTADQVAEIGIILLVCVVLYVIPRTTVLGAVLITGYLGGAVCIQVRAGFPLAMCFLGPAIGGVITWGALFLLEPRLRALYPFKS